MLREKEWFCICPFEIPFSHSYPGRWLPKSSLQVVNRAVASSSSLKRDGTGDKYITKGQVNSSCALFNGMVKAAWAALRGIPTAQTLLRDRGAPQLLLSDELRLHLSDAELCLLRRLSCKLWSDVDRAHAREVFPRTWLRLAPVPFGKSLREQPRLGSPSRRGAQAPWKATAVGRAC